MQAVAAKTAQANRALVVSAMAIRAIPAIRTAGNIPMCSQPRIIGLTGVGSWISVGPPSGCGGFASESDAGEVMCSCYLRNRR